MSQLDLKHPFNYGWWSDNGKLREIETYLKQGGDPNAGTIPGTSSPLLQACINNQQQIALLLIQAGADVNFRSNSWGDPLSLAVRHKDYHFAKVLLEFGADISGLKWGDIPWENLDEEILELLISFNFNVRSILREFVKYKRIEKLTDFVRKLLVDYNLLEQFHFMSAVHKGDLRLIKELINGFDIRENEDIIEAALATALNIGSRPENVALFLLEKTDKALNMVDVGVGDRNHKQSALAMAALNNYKNALSELVKRLGNPPYDDTVISSWKSAIATQLRTKGNSSTLSILLSRDAPVNEDYGKGNTPLSIAAGSSDAETVQVLLENGADIKRRNAKGWTPLLQACHQGTFDTVKLLLDNGADVNETATLDRNITGLMLAADRQDVGLIKLLLERGANPEQKDDAGLTAGHYAKFSLEVSYRWTRKEDVPKLMNLFPTPAEIPRIVNKKPVSECPLCRDIKDHEYVERVLGWEDDLRKYPLKAMICLYRTGQYEVKWREWEEKTYYECPHCGCCYERTIFEDSEDTWMVKYDLTLYRISKADVERILNDRKDKRI